MFRRRSVLLIWLADMIAGYCSRRFVSFLMSEPGQHSGAWPNFKTPRLLAADGNLAEAIQFAEIELEKEPENLEGLLLLANLHEDKGEPTKAIQYWRQVEQSPSATDAQKELARSTSQRLEQLA
jgi:tetratricopeptide (TPR) repeat protein